MLDTEKAELIAPCGMNCSVCSKYLARKHDIKSKGVRVSYCTGCRPRDKKCAFLKKHCDSLLNHTLQFCYECSSFPYKNLVRLDARYQKDYRMSWIENLAFIEQHSLDAFIERERTKWQCKKCGALLCCHNGICFICSVDLLLMKKQLYEWGD